MSYIINVINAANETVKTANAANDCQIYKFLQSLKNELHDASTIVKIVTDSGDLYKHLICKRLANNSLQFVNIAPAACAAHKSSSTATNVTISKIEIINLADNTTETDANVNNNCQLYKRLQSLKNELTNPTKIIVYDNDNNVIKTLVSKIQFVDCNETSTVETPVETPVDEPAAETPVETVAAAAE